MLTKAQEIKPKLVELRRTIHKQPELGFEVHKTAELVAQTLGALGIECQRGVGKTGVVGYIGDGEGPIIGIRADMDALPILEANEVEYKSQVPGKMHACGHDAHTTMLLGVAMLLSKEKIKGQVRLLFQPSEESRDSEGKSGAPRMIEDGALKDVNYVIALHVNGVLEAGTVAVNVGKSSAASDKFEATILGTGGHGAYPYRGTDPIWMLSQVLSALYAIPSRRIDPQKPAVVTVGAVHGGEAGNVIPSQVKIVGTLRSKDDEVREQLVKEVRACLELVKPLGGDYELKIDHGFPSMINDAQVCEVIKQSATTLLGEKGLVNPTIGMGAEDFSYMTRIAPGAMFQLGIRPADAPIRVVHTPTFDIDEEALPVGAAMLAETTLRLLKKDG